MLGVIMIGIVEVVKMKRGSAGVEKLRKVYGKSLNFKEFKNYPEEEFQRFAGLAMKIMNYSSVDEFQRGIAPPIFKFLIEKFPEIPKKYNNLYSFLTAIADVHYSIPGGFSELRKIDAVESDPDKRKIVLKYKSPNKLDVLFLELLKTAAKYYGEKIEMTVKSKMSEGGESTVVEVQII